MALNKNQIYWWWEFNNNYHNDPVGYAAAVADFLAAMTILNSAGYKNIICTTLNHQVTPVYTDLMAGKPATMELYGGLKTRVHSYDSGTIFMEDEGGMDSLSGWANHAAALTIVKNLTGNKLVFLDNESCFDPNNDGGMDYMKSEMRKALAQLPRGLTYTSHPAYAWTTTPIWNKYSEVNRLMFRELGRVFRFMERSYDSPRSVDETHINYTRRQNWKKRLNNIIKLRPSPNRRRKFQLVYFFENDGNFWLDAEIPTAMSYKQRTEDLIIYPGSGRTREQAAIDITAILETV